VRTACQFPHFLLICDLQIPITITIAIKNRSWKNRGRFSSQNRSAISGSKSDPGIHCKIDQRLKNSSRTINTDGTENRIPIFVRKSIRDFVISIAITIPIKNRSGKIDQRFSFPRLAVFPFSQWHNRRNKCTNF